MKKISWIAALSLILFSGLTICAKGMSVTPSTSNTLADTGRTTALPKKRLKAHVPENKPVVQGVGTAAKPVTTRASQQPGSPSQMKAQMAKAHLAKDTAKVQ
jgi:hypothetical protein